MAENKTELKKAIERWKAHVEIVHASTAININETAAQRIERIRRLRSDYAAFVD